MSPPSFGLNQKGNLVRKKGFADLTLNTIKLQMYKWEHIFDVILQKLYETTLICEYFSLNCYTELYPQNKCYIYVSHISIIQTWLYICSIKAYLDMGIVLMGNLMMYKIVILADIFVFNPNLENNLSTHWSVRHMQLDEKTLDWSVHDKLMESTEITDTWMHFGGPCFSFLYASYTKAFNFKLFLLLFRFGLVVIRVLLQCFS